MRSAPRKPNEAESKIEPAKNDNLIVQTREYELITPLFGGGVEPGQCDDLTPIRGTEIRGHLRFWWRATRGGNPLFEGKLEKMKEAEDKLWGAASTQTKAMSSDVHIAVKCVETGSEKHPFTVEEKRNHQGVIERYPDGTPKPQLKSDEKLAHPYAAFPLQPTQKEMRPGWKSKTMREKVKFVLTISFPKGQNDTLKKEIEAALWAWELFGGIGARSRRGFGAVQLLSIDGAKQRSMLSAVNLAALYEDIKSQLKTHVVANGNWPNNVPHLSWDLLFDTTMYFKKAPDAWTVLIQRLKEFRQQRNSGNGNRPGRSKWPEPEAIRIITKQRLAEKVSGKSSIPIHQQIQPNYCKFPRAAFGLPIVFHFQNPKGRTTFDADSDPRKTVLKFEKYERLASPLILRSIPVASGEYVGLALILEGTGDPNSLRLALYNDEERDKCLLRNNLKAGLDQTEADQIKEIKASGKETLLLNGRTDVLCGFLDFLVNKEDE